MFFQSFAKVKYTRGSIQSYVTFVKYDVLFIAKDNKILDISSQFSGNVW